MRELTLILPHFCNIGMLAEHSHIWSAYREEERARLHVIIVDDCSPKGEQPSHTSINVRGLASVRIYRTLQKVRWNWLFARNLGAQEATTEWRLFTDIDHVLPSQTLNRLVYGPLNPEHVYRFSRVDVLHPWPWRLKDCPAYKPHPNTWLMTRAMYDDIGGYDERLSGCYGTDAEFRSRVQAKARAVVMLPEVMVRYPREVIPDASTLPSVYTRKNDPENNEELAKRREVRERIPHWRPLRVTFPYELVYDSTAVLA